MENVYLFINILYAKSDNPNMVVMLTKTSLRLVEVTEAHWFISVHSHTHTLALKGFLGHKQPLFCGRRVKPETFDAT